MVNEAAIGRPRWSTGTGTVLALLGLGAITGAEILWHWYISNGSQPLAHVMLQYYVQVDPNRAHASELTDWFLPVCVAALWLVAVGRGHSPIWWSVVMSLVTSGVLFCLLWVYAFLLPVIPVHPGSLPRSSVVLFRLILPGTAGLVLRYLQFLVPIAGMQVIAYWRWRKGGER